jgi:hypothetical protein
MAKNGLMDYRIDAGRLSLDACRCNRATISFIEHQATSNHPSIQQSVIQSSELF